MKNSGKRLSQFVLKIHQVDAKFRFLKKHLDTLNSAASGEEGERRNVSLTIQPRK